MIAIDTNILVRFLVSHDRPEQGSAAQALFKENEVALPHTVLLETEWVLRRAFRFSREQIADALSDVLALRTILCPRRDFVLIALRAFRGGCDFADALHATTSEPGVREFLTFDRDFARRAKALGLAPPVRLLAAAD
jgi:predicted nucleic-acid-binding protein